MARSNRDAIDSSRSYHRDAIRRGTRKVLSARSIVQPSLYGWSLELLHPRAIRNWSQKACRSGRVAKKMKAEREPRRDDGVWLLSWDTQRGVRSCAVERVNDSSRNSEQPLKHLRWLFGRCSTPPPPPGDRYVCHTQGRAGNKSLSKKLVAPKLPRWHAMQRGARLGGIHGRMLPAFASGFGHRVARSKHPPHLPSPSSGGTISCVFSVWVGQSVISEANEGQKGPEDR